MLRLSPADLDQGLNKDRHLSVVNATQAGIIREIWPADSKRLLLFFLGEHRFDEPEPRTAEIKDKM
jgi:hypothetical protein